MMISEYEEISRSVSNMPAEAMEIQCLESECEAVTKKINDFLNEVDLLEFSKTGSERHRAMIRPKRQHYQAHNNRCEVVQAAPRHFIMSRKKKQITDLLSPEDLRDPSIDEALTKLIEHIDDVGGIGYVLSMLVEESQRASYIKAFSEPAKGMTDGMELQCCMEIALLLPQDDRFDSKVIHAIINIVKKTLHYNDIIFALEVVPQSERLAFVMGEDPRAVRWGIRVGVLIPKESIDDDGALYVLEMVSGNIKKSFSPYKIYAHLDKVPVDERSSLFMGLAKVLKGEVYHSYFYSLACSFAALLSKEERLNANVLRSIVQIVRECSTCKIGRLENIPSERAAFLYQAFALHIRNDVGRNWCGVKSASVMQLAARFSDEEVEETETFQAIVNIAAYDEEEVNLISSCLSKLPTPMRKSLIMKLASCKDREFTKMQNIVIVQLAVLMNCCEIDREISLDELAQFVEGKSAVEDIVDGFEMIESKKRRYFMRTLWKDFRDVDDGKHIQRVLSILDSLSIGQLLETTIVMIKRIAKGMKVDVNIGHFCGQMPLQLRIPFLREIADQCCIAESNVQFSKQLMIITKLVNLFYQHDVFNQQNLKSIVRLFGGKIDGSLSFFANKKLDEMPVDRMVLHCNNLAPLCDDVTSEFAILLMMDVADSLPENLRGNTSILQAMVDLFSCKGNHRKIHEALSNARQDRLAEILTIYAEACKGVYDASERALMISFDDILFVDTPYDKSVITSFYRLIANKKTNSHIKNDFDKVPQDLRIPLVRKLALYCGGLVDFFSVNMMINSILLLPSDVRLNDDLLKALAELYQHSELAVEINTRLPNAISEQRADIIREMLHNSKNIES